MSLEVIPNFALEQEKTIFPHVTMEDFPGFDIFSTFNNQEEWYQHGKTLQRAFSLGIYKVSKIHR